MRYLVQFLIPALIFVGVVYALTRRRPGGEQSESDADSDAPAFVIILLISGAVALGTAYLLFTLME